MNGGGDTPVAVLRSRPRMSPRAQDVLLAVTILAFSIINVSNQDQVGFAAIPILGFVLLAAASVLLLWRHRFVTDTWGWEVPAGRVDASETAMQAAQRETLEETGWRIAPQCVEHAESDRLALTHVGVERHEGRPGMLGREPPKSGTVSSSEPSSTNTSVTRGSEASSPNPCSEIRAASSKHGTTRHTEALVVSVAIQRDIIVVGTPRTGDDRCARRAVSHPVRSGGRRERCGPRSASPA